MRTVLRLFLLSLAFVVGTAVLGWWAVPLIGLTWGIVGRATRRPALTAACAAGLAWTLILGWSAVVGPVGLLAAKLGGIASTSGAVFAGLTVLLPFSLAFLAARIARR